jgi:hypothetical protein
MSSWTGESTLQEYFSWVPSIKEGNAVYRNELGPAKVAAFTAATHLLALPRIVCKSLRGDQSEARSDLQLPWLPLWPALAAQPLHHQHSYGWTRLLRQAYSDIRTELERVCDAFGKARYDSAFNAKRWWTYYFYLHGRPLNRHLAACPRTRDVLAEVPHNGLHVCFSALEPGGGLHPHTGPTNASLTAHLGLANCAGTRLWVAGETAEYRDSEVLVFDDSFVHAVENGSGDTRYTLMVTFWHPELNALERELLHRVVRTVD